MSGPSWCELWRMLVSHLEGPKSRRRPESHSSRGTFHFHSFQGSFFSGNQKPRGNSRLLKRTMVEQNGESTRIPGVLGGITALASIRVQGPHAAASGFGCHKDGGNTSGSAGNGRVACSFKPSIANGKPASRYRSRTSCRAEACQPFQRSRC